MKIEIINRNGEKFYFEKINENSIKWSGVFKYIRIGKNKENIEFIDPIGGPYLEIGQDMKIVSPLFKGKIIKSFKKENDYFIISV